MDTQVHLESAAIQESLAFLATLASAESLASVAIRAYQDIVATLDYLDLAAILE